MKGFAVVVAAWIVLGPVSLGSVGPGPEPAAGGTMTCQGRTYALGSSEAVANGGFENDLTGWWTSGGTALPSISTAVRHSGAKSALVDDTGHPGNVNAAQTFSTPFLATYALSYWMYVDSWGSGGMFAVMLVRNWDPSTGANDGISWVGWTPPNTMTWTVWRPQGGGGVQRTYAMTLGAKTWHRVETVVDGALGVQCLYVDGSFVDSATVSPASTFLPENIIFGDVTWAGNPGVAYYDDLSILPLTPACTYTVSQGSTHYDVLPVETAQSVAAFYDYFSESAHTPYVEAYASVLYLVLDTASDSLYFVFHFNVDGAGSTDAEANALFQGIPGGAGVAVSDDPGEFSLGRSPQGQFHYWLNTDGGAVGPLPQDAEWRMNVTFTHFGPDPPTSQKWVDHDGTRDALAMVGTISIARVCNQAPTADAGGPYSWFEGSAILFSAGRSSDPDGDPLTYRWDFQADGTWDTGWSSDPTATFTYGDDWQGHARVEVSDGTLTDTAEANVTVANVPPEIAMVSAPGGDEGQTVSIFAHVTDPGSDDLTFAWSGECSGWSAPTTYLNDPAVGPDPHPSPTNHPRDVYDPQAVTCGDDGVYAWHLVVTDDDGGSVSASGSFPTGNLPPGFPIEYCPQIVGCNAVRLEGDVTLYRAHAADPGSDDLAFTWRWGDGTPAEGSTYFNDGVGPDPPHSPNGTYPFEAADQRGHAYGDNGEYRIEVAAADDDGASTVINATVTILNVPPAVDAGADRSTDEGALNDFTFRFSDPGFDQPSAGTWENFTATVDWGDGTSAPLAVTKVPGGPGVPTTGTMQASHYFADNGVYTVLVRVCDDDGGCGTDTLAVNVGNVPPTVDAGEDRTIDEGALLNATFRFSDPGYDFPPAGTWENFTANVTWGDTTSDAPPVDKIPGGPGVPTTGTVDASHVYADDGSYVTWVTVCDDDGGCGSDRILVTVNNVPPTVDAGADAATDEGSLLPFTFTFSDPGFDFPAAGTWENFTATVRWGDGTAESLAVMKVPGGPGVPTTGWIPAAHVYADNGVYEVLVTVCDDDGGCGNDSLLVTVANVPPTIDAGADWTIDEAGLVDVRVTGTDPGFDFPAGGTWENFTATIDWGYGPAESVAVEKIPGGPGVPTQVFVNTTHAYGDNGVFVVTVTVCDDDGGCGTDAANVTVDNVAPVIDDVQAYVVANLTLRVAGEKWHDVRMDLVWNGNVTGSVRVVRMPGSPDDQSGTIEGAHIPLLGAADLVVYYTPDDDPVNGQPNGANPAWVFVELPDGSVVRFHHTFNVRHPETWTWHVGDLRALFVGQRITFAASAHDVGSDDLTFAWDFGDGSTATSTVYNNGVSPDPFPSPEVNPIAANDAHEHAYAAAGTYAVTLTVTDDDGGVATATFPIGIPG